MTQQLIMGEAGRIEIPASMREELQLAEGDPLQIETVEGRIILSHLDPGPNMRREQGIWVYHSEEPIEISTQLVRDLMDESYDERERRILGLKPKDLS